MISNSPFFTASLDTDFLRKKTVRYFLIFGVFILLVASFGQAYVTWDMEYGEMDFEPLSFWSQPFCLYDGNGPVLVRSGGFMNRKIAQIGKIYRFSVGEKPLRINYEGDDVLIMKVRKAGAGKFIFAMKMISVIVSGVGLFLSRRNAIWESNMAINMWAFGFLVFRLIGAWLPMSLEYFWMSVFWLWFIALVFYQSKILCTSIVWVKAGMVSIVIGTTAALILGLACPIVANSCVFIWVFIPLICGYLFRVGKSIFSPKLLIAHFGFIDFVTGAVFLTALSRAYSKPTELTMLNETADVCAVILYIVFQMMYCIGDGKNSNNFSIGNIVQRGNIDNLLDILVAREEEELRSGTTFH